MADHHGPQSQSSRDRHGHGTAAFEDPARSSYETGESSATGSLRNGSPQSDGLREASMEPSPKTQGQRLDGTVRRRQRQRSAGGFLLQDAVTAGRDSHRRQTRSISHREKSSTLPRTPEHKRSNDTAHTKRTPTRQRQSTEETVSPPRSNAAHQVGNSDNVNNGEGHSSPYNQSPDGPDIDSTQIVSMALNLSESRRIASRRNVTQPNPPRLAPLVDSGPGSNLRQHFQQQRRSSRNMSPKPGMGSSPRTTSGVWSSSPLHSTLGTGQDGSLQYQFSASTLARAQKAKDHLELMAQYRRLLEMLPPLKPGNDRSLTLSPPSTPLPRAGAVRFGSGGGPPASQRQYNPLQYIRNRKIRARERKVIDGDRQGFGDVERVKSWVEQASRRASSSSVSLGKESLMPEFPSPDEQNGADQSDPSTRNAQRVRRPRVDWFFEPCDMIADAYWLEQNDEHKSLIEDRHWRKIFPLRTDLSRPMSRQTEEFPDLVTRSPTKADGLHETPLSLGDAHLTKTDTDMTQNSTKDRAKQKLQDLRGFHHRHNSITHNHHDLLRLARDLDSDLSESDNEEKPDRKRSRHGRSGTISGDANDLLQKQMLEIISKEAREKELADVPETEVEHFAPTVPMTPDRNSVSMSPTYVRSRKGSLVDTSDSELRQPARLQKRPSTQIPRSGRASLEVPEDYHRASLDIETSPPSATQFRGSSGRSSAPNISAEVLSWSRPSSPTRNPLTKVKRMLRDKDRDHDNGARDSETDDDGDVRLDVVLSSPIDEKERRDGSPARKIATRPNYQNHRPRHSTNSIRLRDDQAVGLRGIFKGPKIDTVIRGGVSRLGDMLWKKDGAGDFASEEESTDESEFERARGRRRSSATSKDSRATNDDSPSVSRHFLDAMPQFQHVTDTLRSRSDEHQAAKESSVSRSQSRQRSRFDLLKPPPLNVRSASLSLSPTSTRRAQFGESDVSDSNSSRNNLPEDTSRSEKRLEVALGDDVSNRSGRIGSRQWSFSGRGASSARSRPSKRDIARMRALILSSGVKAMEINRRAEERVRPFKEPYGLEKDTVAPRSKNSDAMWVDIAKLTANQTDLVEVQVAQCELYPLAAKSLAKAVQASSQRWHSSADRFATKTSLDLQRRIWTSRTRVADELSSSTRQAATEADETSHDLALVQPLKVKHVVDIIEKMLRRRRRRFRWVRRAMWLTVEWLLVGLMWYVWFVVTILRIFMGAGKGIVNGVRWLLWL